MDMIKEELGNVLDKSSERAEKEFVGEHPVEPSEEDSN